MARLLVKIPDVAPAEVSLNPGCNSVGREGDVDFLLPHPSVSRHHCEVWLTEEAVLVRDLGSRNGTYIEGERVQEAQLTQGQTLRLGDVELTLAEAPARISVPVLPLPAPPKAQVLMPDGRPCCFHHDGVAAALECTKCQRTFCSTCVRELRVAGGAPRRFCPECGGACRHLEPTVRESKRNKWIERIVDAFTKPTLRR